MQWLAAHVYLYCACTKLDPPPQNKAEGVRQRGDMFPQNVLK